MNQDILRGVSATYNFVKGFNDVTVTATVAMRGQPMARITWAQALRGQKPKINNQEKMCPKKNRGKTDCCNKGLKKQNKQIFVKDFYDSRVIV